MANLIEPRTLKGFRDYLPAQMIPRERMLDTVRRVYRSYGFAPIDTPALEFSEILLGKGGAETDKQLYRFMHGRHDVAMRFDLTVPLARFVAQHANDLGMPFKRYHVGPVWRGENTQRGRFREFWQCDFDTIGTTNNAADIETALVIHDLMTALGFERFTVRINNRLILTGLLEILGLAEKAKSLLIALDKLAKIGADAVATEMVEKSQVSAEQAQRILALAQTRGSNAEVIERVQAQLGENSTAAEGITRLRQLLDVVRTAGISEQRICLDLSIARGLDYYTGTIFETFLDELPGIGSVCSGGRYDNLAKLFTKQELPGVGASLGLDRLLAAMDELKLLPAAATPAPVLIVQFDSAKLGEYQGMARVLRASGIGVEVFPEAKKIGSQLQYAERRGFKLALIAGSSEFEQGIWKVKNLQMRTETSVSQTDVVKTIKSMLPSG